MRKIDPRQILESRYRQRRNKLIASSKESVIIIPSNDEQCLSRDREFPYRQNSDLLYLLGLKENPVVLVLRSGPSPKSILYLKERNKEIEKWIGESIGLKRARRRFKVDDIRDISEFEKDLPNLISGHKNLYYPLGTSKKIDSLIVNAMSSPTGPRFAQPNTLLDSRLLTSEMRIIKDKDEIKSLKRAAEITSKALKDIVPHLNKFKSEKHCAAELEALFFMHGGHGLSFSTIVASGKNATVLHHSPSFSPLFKRELVLIDCGAEFNGYTGDVTRVFPVSGKFSSIQAEVYDVVKEALYDGLLKAKAGNSLDDIHQATVKTLVKGLISLGALSGSPAQIIQKGEYKKFYMHRTGHWLGLDVHDISPVTYNGTNIHSYLRPLENGMAFTIEPGLYFDPHDLDIKPELRGIGIRLEEDILITPKGHEVLSKGIPLDRNEIEALF